MRRFASVLAVVVTGCGGDPPLLTESALVAIRWLHGDIEFVELPPGAPPVERGVLAESNRGGSLERSGLGADGEFVCTYSNDGRLRLWNVASGTVTAASKEVGSFGVDGCTVDSTGNVLAFWRPTQIVRTYASVDGALIPKTESSFDTGGPLSGPDKLRSSYDSRQVALASAYSRVEIWRPGAQWTRHGVWMSGVVLGSPAVGRAHFVVPYADEPAIAVVSAEGDGVGRIELPDPILYVAIAPDDSLVWAWSAESIFVVDLGEREVRTRTDASKCWLMDADVHPRTVGYELVGRWGGDDPIAARRCWTDEDGTIEGAEDLRVSDRDVIVSVQTQRLQ